MDQYQRYIHQQVEVPDTLCPLDTTKRQRFLDGLDLVQRDQGSDLDYGVHNFCAAERLLHESLESGSVSPLSQLLTDQLAI